MMDVNDELVAWLRAVLDDEAALAQAWLDGPENGWWWEKPDPSSPAEQLIARFPPSRVLAEVNAKRALIDHVLSWRHRVATDCWYTCPAATEEREGETCCDETRGSRCDCLLVERQRWMLAPIAVPYARFPGYREEWRP